MVTVDRWGSVSRDDDQYALQCGCEAAPPEQQRRPAGFDINKSASSAETFLNGVISMKAAPCLM